MKKSQKAAISLAIIFAVSTIGLSVALGFVAADDSRRGNLLENQYQQAYFVLLDETNGMELKLSKLAASSSDDVRRELLYSVWKSSEVAANSLSALASKDGTVGNTMRFINQTGEFSKYLADIINKGGKITAEQLSSLTKIRDMMRNLGVELGNIKDEIENGYLFTENVGTDRDVLIGTLGKLNEASVKYPRLIYDGPFSEALSDKTPVGLVGDDLTHEKGAGLIPEIFSESEVKNVRFLGEWSTDIDTLNYEATVDGKLTTVQIAKKGGLLISINARREISETLLTVDDCIKTGEMFLAANGFDDMTAVWTCNDNGTYFINYAPTVGGVIIYPDIVKVKIAADNGEILGLEARSYAFNHTARDIGAATLSESEAKSKLSVGGEIGAGKLALIPVGTDNEKLSYEFKAVTDDSVYYIYIDARTGEELNILYVVSSTHGDLLL